MAEEVKGYIVVTVEEANGKSNEDEFLWDSSDFEGFIRAELRGGYRQVKGITKRQPVEGSSITWHEDLVLEVLEGAKELRLMLCKEKVFNSKRGTAVIAACGIFVTDIIDAGPIDKYFELFKPQSAGSGGQIRIGLNFVKDKKNITLKGASASHVLSPQNADEVAKKMANIASSKANAAKRNKRGGLLALPILLALAGTAGVLYKMKMQR